MLHVNRNRRTRIALTALFGLVVASVAGAAEIVFDPITAANPNGLTDYDFSTTYGPCIPPGTGTATIPGIEDAAPAAAKLGGSDWFLDKLKGEFAGWTINSAANALTGRFIISRYKAVGSCAAVGADFTVFWDDGVDDKPAFSKTHWVQVISNNHRASGAHGDNDYKVDGGGATPYYDDGGYANSRFFEDEPRRPDATADHVWTAELYLVEETANKTMTVYDGIEWGWSNVYVPVPEPASLLLLGVGIPLVLARRRATRSV